jgi:hypothetical protein
LGARCWNPYQVRMPQTRDTGARGAENGYRNADDLASLLGARRLHKVANEFHFDGRRVALKTGDRGLVIPEGVLSRVDAVLYGYKERGDWVVYELTPETVRQEASPSQSKSHQNGIYHALSKGQCRMLGARIR